MAQNNIPHFLCDYSAITIADKDAGITKITYSDTVEETPPDSPHKVVPFDFGRGPVPGYYVTSIQAEGAIIPDGSDVQVSYRRQGDEDTVCDTLRNVRKVRPGEYVCDWIFWDGMRPLRVAPDLYEKADGRLHGHSGGSHRPVPTTQSNLKADLMIVLLSDVDTLLRKQESDPRITQQDGGDATEKT